MRNVFLIFGIAAFSAASAQQKDLFDIQKHLLKKQAQGKRTTEHNIFLTLPEISSVQIHQQLFYSLANGDKVFQLPTDNMPCVIPDMSRFQTMPNPILIIPFNLNSYPRRMQPGLIPNVSSPANPMDRSG